MSNTDYKNISGTKKMTGVQILYSVPFDHIEEALKYLDTKGEKGLLISDLFNAMNYNDATGKSMMIRFLNKYKLITKKNRRTIKITTTGREFLYGSIDFRKEHYLNNLDPILKDVLEMIHSLGNGIMELDEIMVRLQKKEDYLESKRVINGKKVFLKRFLSDIGVVELIQSPKLALKITDKGIKFLLTSKNIEPQTSEIVEDIGETEEYNLAENGAELVDHKDLIESIVNKNGDESNGAIETEDSQIINESEEIQEKTIVIATAERQKISKQEEQTYSIWEFIEEIFGIYIKNLDFSLKTHKKLKDLLRASQHLNLIHTTNQILTLIDLMADLGDTLPSEQRIKYWKRLKETVQNEIKLEVS